MEKEIFATQMDRLKSTFGERAYPSERVKLIWHTVKNLPNSFMEPTVNYMVGHYRSFPNVKDFLEKATEFESRGKTRQTLGNGSVRDVLNHAAKHTGADKEFVSKCGQLLRQLTTGKINKVQFDQGCDLLDQAAKMYPNST